MKRIVPAIIVASVGLSLVAQTTGSIQGKVLDSKGRPIPGSKVVVSKTGINWTKEVKVNAEGKFFQVGFQVGEYLITVSAPGFPEFKEQDRIGAGLVLQKDYTLLTAEESAKSGKREPLNESTAAESLGLESFNQGVVFYNAKDYLGALPLFESALKNLSESLSKSTDAAAKTDLEKKLANIERPYAFTLAEIGKSDDTKRAEYFSKAEPILAKAIEQNPKDQNALVNLLEIATAKKDTESITKYQAALDILIGPRPELAYNQGVELYNAGKLAEAKPFFLKSLGVKADFADAYYLLAMCEFSENNLKGTKANLQKYIELAPTGKHAAEVKAMLADPSLKNIK